MAENGGNGGGAAPAAEPVDDDVMRDAVPNADGDARADGAVGEVEVVTRVEQPCTVTIGVISKELTVAQMKDAATILTKGSRRVPSSTYSTEPIRVRSVEGCRPRAVRCSLAKG